MLHNSLVYKPRTLVVLQAESPFGKCAKLHTAAASNNRDHSVIACSCHIYVGVVLGTHPVHCGLHIQCNAN